MLCTSLLNLQPAWMNFSVRETLNDSAFFQPCCNPALTPHLANQLHFASRTLRCKRKSTVKTKSIPIKENEFKQFW
eukprot:m.422606 g.422606  ORF g.422606 m.422606 type:complete len:76 (-) comp21329_c1_seq8:2692-2919(-)